MWVSIGWLDELDPIHRVAKDIGYAYEYGFELADGRWLTGTLV